VETKEIKVQRFSVTSAKGFHDVVAAFDAAIGHPDMNSFSKNVADAKTFAEVEKIVQEATGPSELMEFTRMDLGRVLQKRNGARARQSLRFVVGNPVTMRRSKLCWVQLLRKFGGLLSSAESRRQGNDGQDSVK
jgi:hypothetical protein